MAEGLIIGFTGGSSLGDKVNPIDFGEGEQEHLLSDWNNYLTIGDPRGGTYKLVATSPLKPTSLSIQFSTVTYIKTVAR